MSTLSATYSVVLRAGLPEREVAFLSHLCSRITSPGAPDLLHFACTSIDTSHHFYIQLEAFKSGDTSTHPVQVPHHFVLLIWGADLPKSMGFSVSS